MFAEPPDAPLHFDGWCVVRRNNNEEQIPHFVRDDSE